eukprot:EG_transcript_14918
MVPWLSGCVFLAVIVSLICVAPTDRFLVSQRPTVQPPLAVSGASGGLAQRHALRKAEELLLRGLVVEKDPVRATSSSTLSNNILPQGWVPLPQWALALGWVSTAVVAYCWGRRSSPWAVAATFGESSRPPTQWDSDEPIPPHQPITPDDDEYQLPAVVATAEEEEEEGDGSVLAQEKRRRVLFREELRGHFKGVVRKFNRRMKLGYIYCPNLDNFNAFFAEKDVRNVGNSGIPPGTLVDFQVTQDTFDDSTTRLTARNVVILSTLETDFDFKDAILMMVDNLGDALQTYGDGKDPETDVLNIILCRNTMQGMVSRWVGSKIGARPMLPAPETEDDAEHDAFERVVRWGLKGGKGTGKGKGKGRGWRRPRKYAADHTERLH